VSDAVTPNPQPQRKPKRKVRLYPTIAWKMDRCLCGDPDCPYTSFAKVRVA